jgi:hypothetical protein
MKYNDVVVCHLVNGSIIMGEICQALDSYVNLKKAVSIVSQDVGNGLQMGFVSVSPFVDPKKDHLSLMHSSISFYYSAPSDLKTEWRRVTSNIVQPSQSGLVLG